MNNILSHLKISQNFGQVAGVKKLISTIRISKPKRQQFVRVRQGDEWQISSFFYEDTDTRDLYLVDKKIISELSDEITPRQLFTAITREGDVFVWPVRLNKDQLKPNSWNESALKAALQSMTSWIRILPNRANSSYDIYQATGLIPEPEWPELSFEKILDLAFKDRVIDSTDHPILKKLRGEL